jgi:hypothetical protein
MAQTQTNARQGLVELIEAYAVAKTTSNATLIMLATQALQKVLELVEVRNSIQPQVSAADDFAAPEPVAAGNGRPRSKRAE